MTIPITSLAPKSLWSVLYKDEGHWRAGLYSPQFFSPDEISTLERHTCPELFVCLGGRAGLIIGSGAGERIVEMGPHQALLVTDYHNGYRIDESAYFLAIERTAFSTQYIDRKTGALLKKAEVS